MVLYGMKRGSETGVRYLCRSVMGLEAGDRNDGGFMKRRACAANLYYTVLGTDPMHC